MDLTAPNLTKPALLSALDSQQRISSKWIALETLKLHKNVIRDVEMLTDEAGSNLSPVLRANGQVDEYLIPLPLAVLILARYEGEKARAARKLLLEALHYFIDRAPYAEQRLQECDEEIARLRNENQTLAANQKSIRSGIRSRIPSTKKYDTVALTARLFGLPFVQVKMSLDEMSPFQRLMMSVIHDLRSAKGSNEAAMNKATYAAQNLREKFCEKELHNQFSDMAEMIMEIATSIVDFQEAR